jgi:Xaa-Pro aminopeptidase
MAKRRTSRLPHHKLVEISRSRLRALRASMRKASVSHLLVTDPTDVGYLTGFLGGDSSLIVGPGKPTIVSDTRYQEELELFRPVVKVVMRKGSMMHGVGETVRAIADSSGIEALGVQSEHLTLADERALREAFKKRRVPAGLITPTHGLVGVLRRRKDKDEIRLIREAARLQQDALLEALEYLRPGMTEIEFAAELEYQMKARGSTAPGFGTIVAEGANGSLPHYRPSDAKIRGNSTLLVDWGATWLGYRADMTRTFALGRWPKQMRDVYNIVLEAHQAAASALKPGKTGAQIDGVARGVIEEAGYGEAFAHGLGHGLGMDVHEAPRLSRLAEHEALEPGHVVTIEPGIYLPGVGGVRIEDDYVLTERGSRNLCTLPKDIEWATI